MYKITPALGWNTWNTFTNKINEDLVLRSADAMANSPLRKAGYEYIVIDDCWSLHERDKNGRLVADPEKFPHGMKYVGDYIHSLGLKFGIYSCAGALTCAKYPGSYEHEFTDAETFASWGVDYLKYDFCFHSNIVPPHLLYKRMGIALANCGRDILYSACSWGSQETAKWIRETGAHSWRSTQDIQDCWSSVKDLITSQLHSLEYNGQGCFNDMDMLICGMNGKGDVSRGGCTQAEYHTHFAFWCFFGSTLMLGSDIRAMDEETLKLVTNPLLLRLNQDKKYSQPFMIGRRSDAYPLMAKFLDDGKIAIGFFNLTDGETSAWHSTFLTDEIGLPESTGKKLKLTDTADGTVLYSKNGCFSVPNTAAHASRVYIAEVIDA